MSASKAGSCFSEVLVQKLHSVFYLSEEAAGTFSTVNNEPRWVYLLQTWFLIPGLKAVGDARLIFSLMMSDKMVMIQD